MNIFNDILFFDIEVNESQKIHDIGALLNNLEFHSYSLPAFYEFSKHAKFICGHNIVEYDLEFLNKSNFVDKDIIDTLYLSTLIFSEKPYHHLVKDYRLNKTDVNNPLADSKLAKKLLEDIIARYTQEISDSLKNIYYCLLKDKPGFGGFFKLMDCSPFHSSTLMGEDKGEFVKYLIRNEFKAKACIDIELDEFIQNNSIELAYALSLISTTNLESLIPPWLLHNFPKIPVIINDLKLNRNCKNPQCQYCNEKLDVKKSLDRFFGYKNFRRFSYDDDIPLQEKVVNTALDKKSLLAIFPTGGGKSLSFQLPALIEGESLRSLTVVISPLQSLMKDQIDVLKKRYDVTNAVTINGLLSPLERSEAIRQVFDGEACLLYISPESLRSNTILSLLKGRHISRFVIDEAHCFSSWGQDFRVDYLYIGDFLKMLIEDKNSAYPIPVSCFTATAKPAVIEDIVNYFQEKLGLELAIFIADTRRENLHFGVYEVVDKVQKYQKLKNLLTEKDGPRIIYVSRTKIAEELAEQLRRDGFNSRAYHGQMDADEKIQIQNDFMEGKTDIIIATSAFGMGVDKDNVSMVIHYEISPSLENYIQEAGRAARKEDINADCYILFDENDLNKHFSLLNASKLNHKEINQIWRGIKNIKKENFTKSALEIAKTAGWDTEITNLENKVKTAISALEDCSYIKRGQNSSRIFASSLLIRNVSEANKVIENCSQFNDKDKLNATRIVQSIITYQETRVDYIADVLGLEQGDVSYILNVFKEIGITGDTKDLTAFVDKRKGQKNFNFYSDIEKALIKRLNYSKINETRRIYLKELNEELIKSGIEKISLDSIKNILRYWSLKKLIRLKRLNSNFNHYEIEFKIDYEDFIEEINKRIEVAFDIFNFLCMLYDKKVQNNQEQVLIEFSLLEIKSNIENTLFATINQNSIVFYEQILLYLHETGSIQLEGGLLVFYNAFKITRLESDNKKQFTKDNYKKLGTFYENKIEQIHIIGEYAKKMLKKYEEAMTFINEYFTLDYKKFVNKYFPDRKIEIKRPLTETKFKKIFGTLSPQQLDVIKDDTSKNILVIAGPGSGKTKILIHKVASLLLMEDVKPEQFLMLTFSRPAAMEIKKRLQEMVGNVAYYIDIFTYHSLAFNILGRPGSIEKAGEIIQQATNALLNPNKEDIQKRIDNKTVLVVDEYQDISEQEFNFLNAIIEQTEKDNLRIIVVGDDDQNIYEFRGSSVKYMRDFQNLYAPSIHYLDKNFRSKANIVEFSNQFIKCLPDRMKGENSIIPDTEENGNIKIIKYRCRNFLLNFIEDIITSNPKGTTGVLTSTNEEAMLVNTLLRQNKIPSKLIMANEGFSLKNFIELRTFTDSILPAHANLAPHISAPLMEEECRNELGLIPDQIWEEAKNQISRTFQRSSNLELVLNVIIAFEKVNTRKFRSEWLNYMNEIKIEDFYSADKDKILVCTMHKTKGKEFDNVFLLLNNYQLASDEKKRVVYVAITRAKENLHIHTNQNYFDSIRANNLCFVDNKTQGREIKQLIIQLTLKDISLWFCKKYSNQAAQIMSGDKLEISKDDPNILHDKRRRAFIKYSKFFQCEYEKLLEKGYSVKNIEVGYVVVWRDKDDNKEYRVILPRIEFGRE